MSNKYMKRCRVHGHLAWSRVDAFKLRTYVLNLWRENAFGFVVMSHVREDPLFVTLHMNTRFHRRVFG